MFNFSKIAPINKSRPCPKSLNIIPNKKGTVVNIKIDGISSLCFGTENNSVMMLTYSRHLSLGIMVLCLILTELSGNIADDSFGRGQFEAI